MRNTEDNEVNITVMDPQCNHLASRCWYKVFGVFLFTVCLQVNPKNKGFDHLCCFGRSDAATYHSVNAQISPALQLKHIFTLSSPEKTTGLEICLNAQCPIGPKSSNIQFSQSTHCATKDVAGVFREAKHIQLQVAPLLVPLPRRWRR